MRNGQKAREDHRVRYTRRVLKDALISMMRLRPVTEIGIKEICAKAEVSHSTFYAHYEGVYDLLGDIEEEVFTYIDDSFRQIEALTKRGSRKYPEINQKNLEFIAEKGNPLQVLLSENGDINFQKKFFSRMINQTRKIIEDATGNPAGRDIYEGYSVFFIHGSMGLIQHWLKNNMHIPIPTLAKMLDKLTQETI